jgi:hypothetical protein
MKRSIPRGKERFFPLVWGNLTPAKKPVKTLEKTVFYG